MGLLNILLSFVILLYMDKKQRQLLKQKKYYRRLKIVANIGFSIKESGKWKRAKWFELIGNRGCNVYRTTGTPCSCWMCSFNKYNRLESKKETKRILQES